MKKKELEKMLKKFKSEVVSELKPEIGKLVTILLSGKDLHETFFGHIYESKTQDEISYSIVKYINELIRENREVIVIKEMISELKPLLDALKSEEFIDKVIDRINRKQLGGK